VSLPKGYLKQELAKLSATGRPLNRPLWWDYPGEEITWTLDDQTMFGDDYVSAPVMKPGVTSRSVYLPHGSGPTPLHWKHEFTGVVYEGGKSYVIPAPVDSLPLFAKAT
jgi:alpha-D-xyloside xylohydrolase